jgi:aldose 1-epimerase
MASLLDAPDACRLAAGDLEAIFLPAHGMLCASLRHRGEELLRRVEDLAGAAAKGSSAGIPLLHPWANRLDGARYHAAGRDVELDLRSPLLHLDGNGLPMHGVPWSHLVWDVSTSSGERIAAHLEWSRPDLLAVFPFRHRLELTATLRESGLSIDVTLRANAEDPVPVSFGFHPYFGLSFGGFGAPLGTSAFDDGFTALGPAPSFALSGGGRRIAVHFLEGFDYAQVFAPAAQDYVALEPMTAATNALVSGQGLRIVAPGESFRAAFRVDVGAA